MRMCGKEILVVFFCFCFSSSKTQESFLTSTSFGLQTHYGSFLTMAPKAQYLRDSYSQLGEVFIQRTSKEWSVTNYPIQWGASILVGNSGSRQYLGKIGGVFPFINLPIINRNKFTSKFRIGGGVGWVQKPYDKETNHKNILIGTAINGIVNFLWQNELSVSRHLFLNAGFSFTHLSNGASTLPNLGINIPALSLGVRYVGRETKITRENFPNRCSRKPFINIYASVGVKQSPWIGSHRYLVNIFNAEVTKRYAHKHQYGGGMILFYDRSMQVNPYTIISDKRKNKNVQVGIYASYEHFFGKLSLPLQLNMYVFNRDIYSRLFQQVGVRYKLSPHVSAQVMLKTHGGKADVIHAGIGYKF